MYLAFFVLGFDVEKSLAAAWQYEKEEWKSWETGAKMRRFIGDRSPGIRFLCIVHLVDCERYFTAMFDAFFIENVATFSVLKKIGTTYIGVKSWVFRCEIHQSCTGTV